MTMDYPPSLHFASFRRLSMTYASRFRVIAICICGVMLAACSGILDVSDPTLIRSGDIANAAGANAERLDAVATFNNNIRTIVGDAAYFTDEWTYDTPSTFTTPTLNPTADLDLRNSEQLEAIGYDAHLGPLTQSFWHTSIAVDAIRQYSPDSVKGDYLAQMYALRGYIILQMAEDICPGFPINDVADSRTVYGGPVTTDSAVSYAVNQLDSALKYVHDSTRTLRFAQVVMGRALLDQGKYNEASAAVNAVQTSDTYLSEPNGRLAMTSQNCATCLIQALGDHEGGNGIPFVSAHDSRIPLQLLRTRRAFPAETLYKTTKGSNVSTDRLTLASGVEARLIEAEAALHNNDTTWFSILNTLRQTAITPAMSVIPVRPTDADSAVNMLYSERAFWLFMTGRRLGDMRRLIKNYGRNSETVFPTGTWHGGLGQTYGTATAIPFNFKAQSQYNPYITTGCTTR